MDATRLGEFAAQYMQQLEEDWPEGVILDVTLVVSLKVGHDPSIILSGCTDSRGWVQEKMLEEALDGLDSPRVSFQDVTDSEEDES